MGLLGCASWKTISASDFDSLPGAFSVPYEISSSGRYLIDISVNQQPPRPFSLDTGATVSVIYDNYLQSLGLAAGNRTVRVKGLAAIGRRPLIENVNFEIGSYVLPLDKIVTLETPIIKDDGIGLLGTDFLSPFVVLFDKDTAMATFVPKEFAPRNGLLGWRRIPLQTKIDVDTDTRLYFAETVLNSKKVSVLIDTGSNQNFINWEFATLDKAIRRLERKLINQGKLQGALETTTLKTSTVVHDLTIGSHVWDRTNVIVMELDTLATVAPVDEPLMVAGSDMFTPWSVIFDLEGRSIYVQPNANDTRAIDTTRKITIVR